MRKNILLVVSLLALWVPSFSVGPPALALSTLFLSGCFEDACDKATDDLEPECSNSGGTVSCDGSKDLFVDKCQCTCVYP